MKVTDLNIPGLKVFEPQIFSDARGFFLESFNEERYAPHIGNVKFVQDNVSKSSKGVLRGMHFQVNNPQGKLVRLISGEVLDFAVDVREGSETFGQYDGVVLSAKQHNQFWIPPGFAHGFLVLSDEAIFEYKCTEYYDPTSEKSLAWWDETVNIDWGFDLIGKGFEPIVSDKDNKALTLKELFK